MHDHHFIILSQDRSRILRMCTRCGITHRIQPEALLSSLKWEIVPQESIEREEVTLLTACLGQEQSEEEDEPDEGFIEFDTTLEHGFTLLEAYAETEQGRQELARLSPELRDVLEHYRLAAEHWVNR